MLLQTCMTFFMLNKNNIFWGILKKRLMVPIDFYGRERNAMEVNGDHQQFDYQ